MRTNNPNENYNLAKDIAIGALLLGIAGFVVKSKLNDKVDMPKDPAAITRTVKEADLPKKPSDGQAILKMIGFGAIAYGIIQAIKSSNILDSGTKP